ncbi:RNA polymerase subunit sigma [Chitinophaga silvatica]|uniref:RNA polymerase subunit sigma n=2 Tax=Chitinophaga silvatica TaxID=2282649 RepID=A0A3E1YAY9_9BACT|nr:RNA polymerase subunit sigma [Chitinophaga silvatica]
MTAVIGRHFGLQHIAIAEDIVSETFLIAMNSWAEKGIPENPTAWLYTVAKNKLKDYLKHEKIFNDKVSPVLQAASQSELPEVEFSPENINDSVLAMIFAVCSPINPPSSQIALALQILCGFSITEIAHAFLSNPETIRKRIQRARKQLREDNFEIKTLEKEALISRLAAVHTTIYLLFNEGYLSTSENQVIRQDLCSEAIRLALILTTNNITNTPATNALLALLCYQSSRLQARLNADGELILFDQQDTSLWNQELITQGHHFIINACTGNELSKYHLEAGIAYWHTTIGNKNKWENILSLYNELLLIDYSPITALNRTFAYAKVYGAETSIQEALKLNLSDNYYYHSLLGYLYSENHVQLAISHYQKAKSLTQSPAEIKAIDKEIQALKNLL